MHGNEVVGREMLLLLVELLCENYGKNDLLTLMVDNIRIHIMPTMNPDGYEKSHEGEFLFNVTYRSKNDNVFRLGRILLFDQYKCDKLL